MIISADCDWSSRSWYYSPKHQTSCRLSSAPSAEKRTYWSKSSCYEGNESICYSPNQIKLYRTVSCLHPKAVILLLKKLSIPLIAQWIRSISRSWNRILTLKSGCHFGKTRSTWKSNLSYSWLTPLIYWNLISFWVDWGEVAGSLFCVGAQWERRRREHGCAESRYGFWWPQRFDRIDFYANSFI